ncbi:translation initiation inhibitor YjgF/endoribonuclease [Acetobacter malorum]|uniref:Translation initiation inhibitor YjgF/endoribonuclease n=1 Tax=Acetobacter malorum TaxID=178901 RepID=A0A177GAM3_9PROT|nr:translation initiation inhibitor YjgF/endoribonuclease [Acetobacter malorum]
MSTTPEARLKDLGITLPTPAAPVANYVACVQTGNLLIVSGQLPLADGKLFATGKLGRRCCCGYRCGSSALQHDQRDCSGQSRCG